MSYVAVFLLFVCVVWVYWDAKKLNAIAEQQAVNIDLQPWFWALLTLVLWIGFFPLYLLNRMRAIRLLNKSSLIVTTSISPAKTPASKVLWAVTLITVALIAGGWVLWSYMTRLPDCSNEETLSLLQDVVRQELAGTDEAKLMEHFNALVKVDINAVETLNYNKDPERYICEAQVSVDLGPEVQAALGITQKMLDTPNFFTALIMGPALQAVYGPLDGLRVKFTSTWAKDKGETYHYVSARLSNPGATGYATLTEIAWARMQEKKTPEAQPVIPAKEQIEPANKTTSVPVNPNAEPSTAVSAPINAGIAQKLSTTWLEAMSKAQSVEEITSLYATQVDFYGKPNVSREVIAREKASFINRWSQRSYRATSQAQVTRNAPDEISWSQAFSYDVSDGTKTRSGQSTLAFTVKRINGSWLIVAESKGE